MKGLRKTNRTKEKDRTGLYQKDDPWSGNPGRGTLHSGPESSSTQERIPYRGTPV